MDYNEIQFCEDHGHCICGNDCGAGCCTTADPCEGHRKARAEERAYWENEEPWPNGATGDPWAMPEPGKQAVEWITDVKPYSVPTQEELRAQHAKRIANLPYKGLPYSVSWCDSEKGWSECACGIIWHYTSACRVPRECWQKQCEDDEHTVVFSYVFQDCHCGGGDPYIEHPCIGHDRDGQPFLGPSRFIDPADKS